MTIEKKMFEAQTSERNPCAGPASPAPWCSGQTWLVEQCLAQVLLETLRLERGDPPAPERLEEEQA